MSDLNGAGLFMIIVVAFFAVVAVVIAEQLKSQKRRVRRWDDHDEAPWREPR